MLDLPPTSPFLVPAQLLHCGASTPVSASSTAASPSPYNNSFTGAMLDPGAAAQDYSSVFCSPPRQSFQLLLRGGEDPVLKEEFELLPPPRRASSRVSNSASQSGLPPLSSSAASAVATAKRGVKARSSASASATGPQQVTKKRPKRKASYLARKEEKEALLKHLEELQSQLNTLKYQAVVHGGFRAQTQTQSRKRLTKSVLTKAVQNHQLAVAGLQAMLSNYSSLQEHSPIETTIRLGMDMRTRRETLLQLKGAKLREAERYIAERSRGMDELKTYSEEERFETPSGDFCSLRFDIIPIRDVRSVRAVFDAMHFYISNIEISISETLGHITIREDDDSSDASISHHRLVTHLNSNIQSESNTVLFSEFTENDGNSELGDGGGGENGFGIIASDFVNDDELYPYRPLERVRRDVSAMMTVTPHILKTDTKKKAKKTSNPLNKDAESSSYNSTSSSSDHEDNEEEEDNEGNEERELVVVLKRWSLTKLHRPDLPIPASTLQELRDGYGRWSDEMLRSIRETLQTPTFTGGDSVYTSSTQHQQSLYDSTPLTL